MKVNFTPGIYNNMPNEDYHSRDGISRSGIMMFLDSPYKYWANYINPHRPPKHSTPAMEFGSAFHTYILEPEKFDKEYVVEIELEKLPKKLLLKNVGRPAFEANKADRAKIEFINDRSREEFDEKAEGKIILTLKEWYVLQEMKNAIMKHPEAWPLIEGAIYEQSYFWQDESGLMVKARPDIKHDNMIVDLKTVNNASKKEIERAVFGYGYDLQMAIIKDGIWKVEAKEVNNFILVCVEKNYPFEIGIYILGDDIIENARKKYKDILIEMKSSFENNYFPSYEPETINLPRWLK